MCSEFLQLKHIYFKSPAPSEPVCQNSYVPREKRWGCVSALYHARCTSWSICLADNIALPDLKTDDGDWHRYTHSHTDYAPSRPSYIGRHTSTLLVRMCLDFLLSHREEIWLIVYIFFSNGWLLCSLCGVGYWCPYPCTWVCAYKCLSVCISICRLGLPVAMWQMA